MRQIFDVVHRNKNVQDGYKIASEIILSQDFMERLIDVAALTYTSSSPVRVAHTLDIWLSRNFVVPVVEYYDKGSAIATVFSDRPGVINVNNYGVNSRSKLTFLSNGAHELGHIIGYGHGSNWTQDTWKGRMMCRLMGDKENKEFSVPYVFARIASQLAKEKWLL